METIILSMLIGLFVVHLFNSRQKRLTYNEYLRKRNKTYKHALSALDHDARERMAYRTFIDQINLDEKYPEYAKKRVAREDYKEIE